MRSRTPIFEDEVGRAKRGIEPETLNADVEGAAVKRRPGAGPGGCGARWSSQPGDSLVGRFVNGVGLTRWARDRDAYTGCSLLVSQVEEKTRSGNVNLVMGEVLFLGTSWTVRACGFGAMIEPLKRRSRPMPSRAPWPHRPAGGPEVLASGCPIEDSDHPPNRTARGAGHGLRLRRAERHLVSDGPPPVPRESRRHTIKARLFRPYQCRCPRDSAGVG